MQQNSINVIPKPSMLKLLLATINRGVFRVTVSTQETQENIKD